MKRLTILIIILALSFSLVSCGNDSENITDSAETTAVVEDGDYAESTEASYSTETAETTEMDEEGGIEDESSGSDKFSYITKTGLNVGNDDYMITDIDSIGYKESNSGTPDYMREEINKTLHIDYDFSKKTITQTIDNKVSDAPEFETGAFSRCDISETLNIYEYPCLSYCSFLLNFDEIDNNQYLNSITYDDDKVATEHISIRPEKNKYDVSDVNSSYKYDEEGRLIEYFSDSEYEVPEGVEIENPDLYINKWQYDEKGRVIQFNNYYHEKTFEYDENNAPIRVNIKNYNLTGARDEDGRFLEYSEVVCDYAYDTYGRIVNIDRSSPSESRNISHTTIEYDINGNAYSIDVSIPSTDGYTHTCYFYRYALKEDLINNSDNSDELTVGEIYNAVKKYCIDNNPNLDLSNGANGATWSIPPIPNNEEYAVTFSDGNGNFQTHFVNYRTGRVRVDSDLSISYDVYDYIE